MLQVSVLKWPYPPEVGMYAVDNIQRSPSDVTCPYCQEPMEEFGFSKAGRIVALDGDRATTEPIPADRCLLVCLGCRQVFTVPTY